MHTQFYHLKDAHQEHKNNDLHNVTAWNTCKGSSDVLELEFDQCEVDWLNIEMSLVVVSRHTYYLLLLDWRFSENSVPLFSPISHGLHVRRAKHPSCFQTHVPLWSPQLWESSSLLWDGWRRMPVTGGLNLNHRSLSLCTDFIGWLVFSPYICPDGTLIYQAFCNLVTVMISHGNTTIIIVQQAWSNSAYNARQLAPKKKMLTSHIEHNLMGNNYTTQCCALSHHKNINHGIWGLWGFWKPSLNRQASLLDLTCLWPIFLFSWWINVLFGTFLQRLLIVDMMWTPRLKAGTLLTHLYVCVLSHPWLHRVNNQTLPTWWDGGPATKRVSTVINQ